MIKPIRFHLFFLFAGFAIGITSTATARGNTGLKTDSIVFLSFRMKAATDTGKAALSLLIKRVRPGKLKKHSNLTRRSANSLACVLTREKGPNDTLWVNNPVKRDVEYVDENQKLQRKTVLSESADFFIRFRQANYRSVSIQLPVEKGKWDSLLLLAL